MLAGIVVTRQLLLHNGIKHRLGGGVEIFMPYSFHDVFFWLTFCNGVLIIYIYKLTWEHDPFLWHKIFWPDWRFAHEYHEDLHSWANLIAFSQGVLWLQMAELFKATKELSALLYSFIAVVSDVIRFMLVLGLWVVGFSIMLYWMLVADELEMHGSFEDSLVFQLVGEDCDTFDVIYFVVMSCMGLTSLDDIFKHGAEIRSVFAICVMLTAIVLLNLLVATMISHYAKMQEVTFLGPLSCRTY